MKTIWIAGSLQHSLFTIDENLLYADVNSDTIPVFAHGRKCGYLRVSARVKEKNR